MFNIKKYKKKISRLKRLKHSEKHLLISTDNRPPIKYIDPTQTDLSTTMPKLDVVCGNILPLEKTKTLTLALMPSLPMLAQVLNLVKIKFDDNYIFEEKYDGERLLSVVYSNDNSEIAFYTRTLKRTIFSHKIILNNFYHNCIFDGEMVFVNINGDIVPICNTGNRNEHQMQYRIFDVQFVNGISVHFKPLNERKKLLTQCLSETSHVKIAKYYNCISKENTMREFDKITGSGGEGLIIKHFHKPYMPNIRHWIKLKNLHINERKEEFDLYLHRILNDKNNVPNILECGYYDNKSTFKLVCKVSSGINNLTRNSIKLLVDTNNGYFKNKIIGTIIADKITKNKSLRHPIFKCLRLDLTTIDLDERLIQ